MYSHQRSKVTCRWKIIFVSFRWWSTGVHRDPNAIAAQRAARFFSNTCQKMRGGKHVKVKKRQRQDILRFRTAARKLILGSIGTPLTTYACVKRHLEPTHLKSSPLFTFSTKSLGQDSPSIHLFSKIIGSRFTTAKIKLGEDSPS